MISCRLSHTLARFKFPFRDIFSLSIGQILAWGRLQADFQYMLHEGDPCIRDDVTNKDNQSLIVGGNWLFWSRKDYLFNAETFFQTFFPHQTTVVTDQRSGLSDYVKEIGTKPASIVSNCRT